MGHLSLEGMWWKSTKAGITGYRVRYPRSSNWLRLPGAEAYRGSETIGRDDFAAAARPQGPPARPVDRLLDEMDRAVQEQDVHASRVMTGRGIDHARVRSSPDTVDLIAGVLAVRARGVIRILLRRISAPCAHLPGDHAAVRRAAGIP